MSTAENRKILHEQECEKMLIQLLSHESEEVQIAAAEAIAIMSENLASRDSIREWGECFKGDHCKSTLLLIKHFPLQSVCNCYFIYNNQGLVGVFY